MSLCLGEGISWLAWTRRDGEGLLQAQSLWNAPAKVSSGSSRNVHQGLSDVSPGHFKSSSNIPSISCFHPLKVPPPHPLSSCRKKNQFPAENMPQVPCFGICSHWGVSAVRFQLQTGQEGGQGIQASFDGKPLPHICSRTGSSGPALRDLKAHCPKARCEESTRPKEACLIFTKLRSLQKATLLLQVVLSL